MMMFESISGIRMNLQKTALYHINLIDIESQNLANVFQCQLSSFPFTYLGVPLSDRKLTQKDWGFLIDKFNHTLQGSKGQCLSLGGRITLLNYVLSAVPLYTLSLYSIPKKVLRKIDQIRRQFVWPSVCILKDFRGMGILDLKQMNHALLLKWWWRVTNP